MRVGAALLSAALAIVGAAHASAQDWKAEWQKTVDAANEEGQLVLYSQPNQDARDFILREFPKAYPKISVSLSVLVSNEVVARIRTERASGKYLWDVALAGPPAAYALEPDNIFDPVMPEIVDPETKNPDLWGGWHDAFIDNAGQYVFAMAKFIVGPWFDALHVPPEKVRQLGLKVLLDPIAKGKIAWHDPVLPGSGTSYAYLLREKLGDDGLKQMITQQSVQFVPEQFQVVENMARGTAWFGIGPPVRSLMAPYSQAGVKTDVRDFGNSPDSNLESIGGGALFVFKNRPHPNATKVFINWLLSKDVQYGMAKATDQASRRKDVPQTAVPTQVPVDGAHYLQPQREDVLPAVSQTVQMVKDIRQSMK